MNEVITLLNSFSLNTIIIVVVAVISLWYGASKMKDYLDTKTAAIKAAERQRVEEQMALKTRLASQEKDLTALKRSQDLLTENINKIMAQVDLLVSSDMADIKSYITQKYNEFMALGYIDVHSFEACQKRFEYYQLEGGNSFVEQLMEELKRLPRRQ